jgi:hypothetical protein
VKRTFTAGPGSTDFRTFNRYEGTITITKSTWGRVRTFTATRMSPRRASIPQSRRIFFGCKVESEQGYGALLSRLVEGSGFHLAILSVLLRPGGGDPFDLVTLAVELNERDERRRGRYSVKAVLLDRDKLGVSPQRDRRMAMKLIPEQLVDPRRASPGTVGIVPLQVDFRP